ncbi:alpha-galactosidase [Pochonia chlamydosporia 170]|uniref:Alpha-galactosidase n=1 Tax=Pochonia chlamydosporia 170 TaxID=1380566 RepID=A0A179FBH3_METCM|nr:alpha-galactosidase [Pochonia chlamydosporia 170]OAQ62459.1 alpha-galactosidase [Pochonia chlamydosporia 170]
MKSRSALITVAGLVSTAAAGQEKLLPLPPMGFSAWTAYGLGARDQNFRDIADTWSKNGLHAAGYNRINLDDGWQQLRRADNNSLVPNSRNFPYGFRALTDYLTNKGFKPGIYTAAGMHTCGANPIPERSYPGSLGYEDIDYKDFENWGFEYIKLDACHMPEVRGPDNWPAGVPTPVHNESVYREVYGKWAGILAKSRKPMVLSNSAPASFYPEVCTNLADWYTVMGWVQKFSGLARHGVDTDGSWGNVMRSYSFNNRLARYQKVGFYNDPDFLHAGSQTPDERKSQFALWCSFSAPLIIGDAFGERLNEYNYLINKDLIAINQDKLVQQATLVSNDGTWDVLTKSLDGGDRVLTILNKGASAGNINVSWERIGLSSKALRTSKKFSVKDLWTGKSLQVVFKDGHIGSTNTFAVGVGGITARGVPSHGTAVFRIGKSDSPVTPTGLIFTTAGKTEQGTAYGSHEEQKCLTDNESGNVTFATCDGSDAQTWRVRPDGRINSLLRPNECIVDAWGKILSLQSGCQSDTWRYDISGNLINGKSKNCLTKKDYGAATAAKCGNELNSQVVALPIGVTVVGQ